MITRTSFPRFFLKERKQTKKLTGWEAAILQYSSTCNAELSGRVNGLYSAEFSRTRVRENRKRFHLGAGGLAVHFDSFLLGSIVLVVKEHDNILRTQSRESWNDYCLGEVPQAVFRNRR